MFPFATLQIYRQVSFFQTLTICKLRPHFFVKMIAALLRNNVRFLILKHTVGECRSPVFLHLYSTSTFSDILFRKHGFPSELASRVGSELTRLRRQPNLENVDSVLSFLKESGFSNAQLFKIIKNRPQILGANLENSIKPKIKIFQNEGFSADDILRTISACPSILCLSVDKNIIPSLSVLKDLLGSKDAVARVLRKSQSMMLFSTNLGNTLVPNVELLNSYGIPMARIRIIVNSYPSCFVLKPEIVRKSAEKAMEMGLNARSDAFMYAIPVIALFTNEAWELKLQAFRNLGFSDSDILTMFRKAPQVFSVSMEKIKKIKELLLATGKFDMSSVVDNPASLKYSIEKRYEPRLRILGVLESRGLIKMWPSLGTISIISDDKFFKQFISPYLDELSDVYIPKDSSPSS